MQSQLSVEVSFVSLESLHCRVSILAFHKALADQPRDPLVVATFCLAVHNGGCLSEAVCIAKIISQPYDSSFHEVLGPGNLLTDENVMDEVKDLADSVRTALSKMTDRAFVSQAMAKYPQAPHSDLVQFRRLFPFIIQYIHKHRQPSKGWELSNLPVRSVFESH